MPDHAQNASLIPSDAMILEHSGGVDRETWLRMGDYTVGEMFVSVAKLRPDAKVLDVGCGCAKVARPLVDYLSDQGAYHGIDVGRECIDWCRQAYREFGNFHFHHADLYSARYNPAGAVKAEDYLFPVDDGSIDLVFLGSVFTHLLPEATRHYLREISRVLRPRGQVIATFFLIDEEGRPQVEHNASDPVLPFTLADGSGCRIGDPEVPEAAIAYEEDFLRQAYEQAGLDLFHISRGRWSRPPITPHWQDDLWARKPVAREAAP